MSATALKLVAPLLAILAITGALLFERTSNRFARPADLIIVSDIHDAELSLAVRTGHSSYGLTGYGPSSYSGGFTDLEWGHHRCFLPFRIYTLVVLLVAVPTLFAWAAHLLIARHEAPKS